MKLALDRLPYANTIAAYFTPYSSDDIARGIGTLLGPDTERRRGALREEGARVAEKYLPERIMPQWREFLRNVVAR